MDTKGLTNAEIKRQKQALADEERRRRLTSKSYRQKIKRDLKAADEAENDVFTASQYGGPTMYGVSHGELASHISTLSSYIEDLLWLSEETNGN